VEPGYELWSGGVGMHKPAPSPTLPSGAAPSRIPRHADPNTVGPIPVGHSG
jgi:hypothetical protein